MLERKPRSERNAPKLFSFLQSCSHMRVGVSVKKLAYASKFEGSLGEHARVMLTGPSLMPG